jgi:hypothetical protein
VKKASSLGVKAATHLRLRERAKKLYKQADALLDDIIQQARPGDEIELPDGDKAVLKDLYLTTNKVFRAHGIGRYELEVVEE